MKDKLQVLEINFEPYAKFRGNGKLTIIYERNFNRTSKTITFPKYKNEEMESVYALLKQLLLVE